jgi:hypothetical protein
MVRDDAGAIVLAGVTSWGIDCGVAAHPGVYVRLGAPALNEWVMQRHPRAAFDVPPVIHSDVSVTFEQRSFHPSPGQSSRYQWDFDGDGEYDDAHGAGVSYSFPPGPRTIGLEARWDGDRATARRAIVVNGTPNAVAAPSGDDYRVAEGRSIRLAGRGADFEGDALSYSWDLNADGRFEAPGLATTFTAAQIDGPATRIVTLQVCDIRGACGSDDAGVRVQNVAPQVNIGPDRRVRRAKRVRFRARIKDHGRDRVSVTWRFGDGRRARGRDVVHAYRRPGLYRATVVARDDDGGVSRDVARVRVRQ